MLQDAPIVNILFALVKVRVTIALSHLLNLSDSIFLLCVFTDWLKHNFWLHFVKLDEK